MRPLTLLLPLLALACTTEARWAETPNGTSILDWEIAQSDRLTIRNAVASDHKMLDGEHAVYPTPDSGILLQVELVAATVRYYEAGRLETRTAPIELDLRVIDNGGFLIERAGCTGPHYQRDDEMVLSCDFSATQPDASVGFTIHARGGGTID